MIFQALYNSAKNKELIIVNGGLCHWHFRKNGQITIREIIVLPEYQNKGIGTRILKKLEKIKGAKSIFAKCPSELDANKWFKSRGFKLVGGETLKSGQKLNHWKLKFENYEKT